MRKTARLGKVCKYCGLVQLAMYGLVIHFIPKKLLLHVHLVSMQPFIVMMGDGLEYKQARTKRKISEIMITWQTIRLVLANHISLISS